MSASFAGSWKHRSKGVLAGIIGGGMVLMVGALWVGQTKSVRWMLNLTPSIPKGLYSLRTVSPARPIAAGEIAVFPIPEPVAALVQARGYLDGSFPLMKPVAAVAGDQVCTDQGRVVVNEKSYGRIRNADREGRPLPHFMFCGRVAADELFVFSAHEQSFDSRHFGPIRRDQLIAIATSLWTL